jgi:hypothetical protein
VEHAAGLAPAEPVGDPLAIPEPSPSSDMLPGDEALAVPMGEPVATADGGLPGHILIPEVPTESTETAACESIARATSAYQPGMPPAAPDFMPYCQDDAGTGSSRMPHADEEQEPPCAGIGFCLPTEVSVSESLAEGTESEVMKLLRQVAEQVATEATKFVGGTGEAEECEPSPYDQEYHRTHPGCPYPGYCHPVPSDAPCPAAPEKPAANNCKPKMYETRKPVYTEEAEEQEPLPGIKLDTMEFRPSDAHNQPIVPRPF